MTKWVCPLCGKEVPDERLFCVDYPPTMKDPDKTYCLGLHPDYWARTAHWPVRKKRLRFYIV